MEFDFDKLTNRFNTNSLKWDVKNDELPMWVADMDFETAPAIKNAIIKRAQHGIFGYSIIPVEWQKSYVKWWKNYHNFEFDENWLIFCTGVVPAISSIVRKITTPGEKVLVQTPVYNIFFNSIVNNGRFIVENTLCFDGANYSIDFLDLEEKLSDPQVSLMILCNPHNPIGKIWNKDILQKIGELCAKYNVVVLSDEIHCDITDPGKNYIPFASVSNVCKNNSITCIAPSKCFNIAGINSAAVVVPNQNLRHKVWRSLNTDEVAEPNAFAIDATIAAFNESRSWLENLNKYIYENKIMAKEFIKKYMSKLNVIYSDATYLLWIDCSQLTEEATYFTSFLRKNTGLWVSAGEHYGNSGRTFIRLNIACSKERLTDGLQRLLKGYIAFLNQ